MSIKNSFIFLIIIFLLVGCTSIYKEESSRTFNLHAVKKEVLGKIKIISLERSSPHSLVEIKKSYLEKVNKLGTVSFQNMSISIYSNASIPKIFLDNPRFSFKTYKRKASMYLLDNGNFFYEADYTGNMVLLFKTHNSTESFDLFKAFKKVAHESYHLAELEGKAKLLKADSVESEFLASLYAFCFTSAFLTDHIIQLPLENTAMHSAENHIDIPGFSGSISAAGKFAQALKELIRNETFDTKKTEHIEAARNWCQSSF